MESRSLGLTAETSPDKSSWDSCTALREVDRVKTLLLCESRVPSGDVANEAVFIGCLALKSQLEQA